MEDLGLLGSYLMDNETNSQKSMFYALCSFLLPFLLNPLLPFIRTMSTHIFRSKP